MMRLVLLCMTIPLVAPARSGKNLQVPKSFETSGLSPDIVTKPPESLVNIIYPTAEACLGGEIPSYRTMVQPEIEYDFKSGTDYIFIMFDPDTPSTHSPMLRSYIIWIEANVGRGKYGSQNETIAGYMPPMAYAGSGNHRIVGLLYEQPKRFDVKQLASLRLGIKRYRFNLENFTKQFGLGNPIAGNYFTTKNPAINNEYYCTNSNTCLSGLMNNIY